MSANPQFITVAGARLAYRRTEGAGPTVVWLCGLGADMEGSKALALDDWARSGGRSLLRFDYSGHGASDGAFTEGTISRWREDALAIIDSVTEGPLVVAGSSMGGWIACLVAMARPERMAGLMLLAPAADFTSALLEPALSKTDRIQLAVNGVLPREGAPPLTRALIEDGGRWNILPGPAPIDVPVRVLQGGKDDAVPWPHALAVFQALRSTDKVFTLIDDGDHRLSRPQDLNRLTAVAEELIGALQP